jgi:hypothetical protein
MSMLNFEFQFGQIVYLKSDTDQLERIVTEYWVRPGSIQYFLMSDSWGSWHYGFEISKTKDILKTTNN